MFQPFAVAVDICSCDSLLNTVLFKVKVFGEEVISDAFVITFITDSTVSLEEELKSKFNFKPVNPPKLVNEVQLLNI